MERETKTVVTPVGQHTVVLKTWLSGRERRAIRSVYLDHVKYTAKEELNTSNAQENAEKKAEELSENVNASYDLDGSIIVKAQDAAITNIVVSVDDVKEDVLNKILDMRDEDMAFIVLEINKITNASELSEEDKKK